MVLRGSIGVRYCQNRTGRLISELWDKGQGRLHTYYVPGFAYHGHWLYLDDYWLLDAPHDPNPLIDEIMALCGKKRDDFDYPQQFFEWFHERYPDGILLTELEAACV